jgi:choline kinase
VKAIILAAGRGSRMRGQCSSRPKCLTKLAGKALLQWQLEALRDAGVDDIAVVCGYLAQELHAAPMPVPYTPLFNPDWEHANMLTSLLCAAEWTQNVPCIVSYSDIVYPARHIRALMGNTMPIAICYDTLWERLWRLRFVDPLSDAESFRQENGLLRKIGEKTQDMGDIQGQYMGLLHFTAQGWGAILDFCRENRAQIPQMDMTGLLRHLLLLNLPIAAVPVRGAWCEVDSPEDLACYARAMQTSGWSHDWRTQETEGGQTDDS